MNNNNILVIPDVHGRTFWREAVLANPNNKIIFLGDYTDPYSDEQIGWEQTIAIFEEIIDFKRAHMDNVILLLGNHDLSYVIGRQICNCRRATTFLNKVCELYKNNLDLFQLAHKETVHGIDFIFTHSGVSYSWFEQHKDLVVVNTILEKKQDVVSFLNEHFNHGKPEPWFVNMLCDYSNFRGYSFFDFGSCVWSDVREWLTAKPKIKPIEGFQVFGHTRLNNKPIISPGEFACLDCRKVFIINELAEIKQYE